MKAFIRSMALLTLTALLAVSLCAPALAEETENVDFAGQIAFDMQSETVKQQVTVKNYVDGDTTHFFVPKAIAADGVLKARYLAVNTPESTGKIEEWGKAAARFTREKLENAEEIWIESDDTAWNLDSTGARDLVWVWYRPKGEQDFRNLNIELLQNGLAIANSSAQNRYGDTCMAAIAQARAQKRNIYSGEKDPDFFYGDAIELTIKELRLHPEAYDGKKVAFTGVITVNHSNSVFIEDYDGETGLYFGFSA
jgi:endonuclease YncB( thermonuclease family)